MSELLKEINSLAVFGGIRQKEPLKSLCAFPIIQSAVNMVNEMNNFQNAKITKYF